MAPLQFVPNVHCFIFGTYDSILDDPENTTSMINAGENKHHSRTVEVSSGLLP